MDMAKEKTSDKAAAFVKLANNRVAKAKKVIGLVGNLFSDNYEYTPAQAAIVMKHLNDATAAVKARIDNPTKEPPAEKIF